MEIKILSGIVDRLRARAELFRQGNANDSERLVGRVLDEVADAIEESLNEPARYDD